MRRKRWAFFFAPVLREKNHDVFVEEEMELVASTGDMYMDASQSSRVLFWVTVFALVMGIERANQVLARASERERGDREAVVCGETK